MHKVLYEGGTGTLYWVPMSPLTGRHMRLTGSPPATYTIEDLRNAEESDDRTIDSGNATLDSVSTTANGAAGAQQNDPRRLVVASSSGIRAGHRYLIYDATGNEEVFRVESIGTAAPTVLRLSAPLKHSYSTGAPVVGIELSATFNSTDAEDEDLLQGGAGPFWLTWSYTEGANSMSVGQPVWLTRYNVVPPCNESDLAIADPALVKLARERYSLNSAILWATDETIADLGARRIDADYYANPEFRSAVVWHALECLARWMKDPEKRDDCRERYKDRRRSMTTTLGATGTVEVDRDENVAPAGSSRKRRGFLARL